MNNKVTAVSGENFEAMVLKSDEPVLVDFWTEWCGPCRQLAPKIEALAEHYAGVLRFVKVNLDDAPTLIGRYAIRAIPTLMLFKNGAEQERIVGATVAEITAMIDRHIARPADARKAG
jgi:thioredoxin 1